MLTRPQLDVPFSGAPLVLVRFVATMLCAALSFRCIETPIRAGLIGRCWTAWRAAQGGEKRMWAFRWTAATLALSCLTALLTAALLTATPAQRPSELQAAADYSSDLLSATPSPDSVAMMIESLNAHVQLKMDAPAAVAAATPTPPTLALASTNAVTAIGDSVMESGGEALQHALGGRVQLDAQQGRQPAATPAVARAWRAAGKLAPVVILHVGNNGIFRAASFEKIMAELVDAKKVIVVNCKVPRAWESPNNDMLAAAVRRYTNAVLVDWHAASADRPELFWKDGHHLKPSGAKVYARLIAQAVPSAAPDAAGAGAQPQRVDPPITQIAQIKR
jgi:lysophospholipase L1-like esterase